MDNKRIINRDFIGVIKDEGGRFKYDEVEIHYPRELVAAIEAMSKDDDCTIMDVQGIFLKYYPKQTINERFYHYIYPYSYRCYCKSVADAPEFCSFDSYKRSLVNQGGYLLRNNETPLGFESQEAYQKTTAWLCDEMNIEPAECSNLLRRNFSRNIIRYIYARNYHETLESIKSSVLMYSDEKSGWRTVSVDFGGGLSAAISTNFSFPCDWYIDVRVYLNNIVILPYLDSVIYPSTQWQIFHNATRSFEKEDRDTCWQSMFLFLVDVANMWIESPQRFVSKYIVEEIKGAVSGLDYILQSSDEQLLEQFKNFPEGEKRTSYVGEMLDSTLIETEPELTVMFEKSDKITGLLCFLHLFRQLSEFDSSVCQFIDKLTALNEQMSPLIESKLLELHKQIQLNKIEFDELNKAIRDGKSRIKVYKEEHFREFEEFLNLTGVDRKNYLNDKPQFAEVYQKYKSQKEQIKELKQDFDNKSAHLCTQKNFMKKFKECQKRIETYLT